MGLRLPDHLLDGQAEFVSHLLFSESLSSLFLIFVLSVQLLWSPKECQTESEPQFIDSIVSCAFLRLCILMTIKVIPTSIYKVFIYYDGSG